MEDNECIFCGSKGVEWPKKYFVSHETRKIKLCEYHMSYPLRLAKKNGMELTDSLFDEWLCSKIRSISKKVQNKDPLYRCTGFIEGMKDKRCIKLLHKENSMCEVCTKRNKERAKEYVFESKIKEIVKMLKQ